MEKELIINAKSSEVDIALLEDKKLVELNKDSYNSNFSVGDVYLGKVKKIMPGLNAAFVDVGYEKDAFLHYLDLGQDVMSLLKYTSHAMAGNAEAINLSKFTKEKPIEKTGKITDVFKSGQQVVVQVAKEPISTKGPRITTEISFAGRLIIVVPFANNIFISQKIKKSEERKRLKRLLQSIVPKNVGVIVRTAAENKMVADLHEELNELLEKWNSLGKKLKSAKAPQRIVSEENKTTVFLRDMLNDSFNNIYIDNNEIFENTQNYLKTIAPDKLNIVKLYKGKQPIFENFGIDKQIKSSFGKVITIRSGIYLIIEHTEALHVIDVNSGNRVNKKNNQEQNALEVNMEAASEIARQLRLRDMGGIIVIDFIDMHQGANRKKLYEHLKSVMENDSAKHSILPPSKFGLVQITRQRVRPDVKIKVSEKCPVCDGTGKGRSSLLLIDEIEKNIRYLLQQQNEKGLTVFVHPFVYAYLKKGISSPQMKWFFKFKKWINIKEDQKFHLLEYRFMNHKKEEIKI